MIRENAEDAVIRHFEDAEGSRKIIANLAEGNNSDMEQWIQIYTEWMGLDDEQKKTEGHGIRRADEARREDPGREPTAARGEGGARSARMAGEIHGKKRMRAQGNRYEEDEDERVLVVPNMEARSSYLQTTYPRDEVEKIVDVWT